MRTAEMLMTYPGEIGVDRETLGRAIQAVTECAQTCTACADACLAEKSPGDLVACIARNLDCATVCRATAEVLTRQTASDAELLRALLRACVAACRSCAQECEKHAGMHEHCRVCAESCRACEDACAELLRAL
ncbi:MAG: four-helix bundle copper-binding protein [Actinomycetota bacterium]